MNPLLAFFQQTHADVAGILCYMAARCYLKALECMRVIMLMRGVLDEDASITFVSHLL